MMREILFRGKRIDNGEWVEGYLTICDEGYFILGVEKIQCLSFEFVPKGQYVFAPFVEVDPETVGQFTGFTAKGKKIFEGDIVVICYETDGEEFSETKRVHYDEKECCWYPMRWQECCEHCDHYTEVKSIEVIGNIHDNPELLEV